MDRALERLTLSLPENVHLKNFATDDPEPAAPTDSPDGVPERKPGRDSCRVKVSLPHAGHPLRSLSWDGLSRIARVGPGGVGGLHLYFGLGRLAELGIRASASFPQPGIIAGGLAGD
jgi:hypothetical protein